MITEKAETLDFIKGDLNLFSTEITSYYHSDPNFAQIQFLHILFNTSFLNTKRTDRSGGF